MSLFFELVLFEIKYRYNLEVTVPNASDNNPPTTNGRVYLGATKRIP